MAFLSEGEIKKNAFEAEKELNLERQKSHNSAAAGGQSPAQDDAAVRELMEMGFTEAQVKEALRICDNNKEHATNYLLGNQQ